MRKRNLSTMISTVLAIVIILLGVSPTYATTPVQHSTVGLDIMMSGHFTVTNAEGEYFTTTDTNRLEGTMEIISQNVTVDGISHLIVEVNTSSSFTYTPDPNNKNKESYFQMFSYPYASAHTENANSITICNKDGNACVDISGKSVSYSIHMEGPNNGDEFITVSGKAQNSVIVENKSNGVSITGVSGITDFTRNDSRHTKKGTKSISLIPYGDPILINNVNSYPFKVTGAYVLGDKLYKGVCAIHAYRVDDTSLMVTWGQVKNAKGYIVYRYNPEKKKYVKVKTIKNPKYTMFVDRNLTLNKTYSYRVKSYTVVKGKTKASKLSYYVSAVTASDTRDNVTKIAPNKMSVSGKAGTKMSMKGTVTTVDGKKVCSSSLRWFSKNKKIATITKAGKLTLKAKGKTYIWAKSHNGENVAVKVTVK